LRLGLVGLAGLLAVAWSSAPARAALTEHQLAAGSAPLGITVGPDSALWFTDPGSNDIGHLTTAGTLGAPFTGLTAAATPEGIVSAPDGNVWFTEATNNALARLTPTGSLTEFPLASLGAGTGPTAITRAGGLLYFTLSNTGRIGSVNPTAGSNALILGSETQSAVVPSGAGAHLTSITPGPDGNLWFTEASSNRVGNINPTLTTINEFATGITAGSAPTGITAGADSALWFTERAGDRIGRITTAGAVTNEFALPTPGSQPTAITSGSDGALWFTENRADQIGRISTSGTVTETPLQAVSSPAGIVAGPDAAVWFTEQGRDRIGRLPTTPQNSALPAITGTATPGHTLSCSAGSWTNSPTAFAYRWKRNDNPIAGATSASYVVTTADTSHKLTCTVAATNGAGSTTATSAAVTVPKPHCVVPNVVGKKRGAAKKALKKAHCAVGKVRKKRSSGKPNRVLSQKPKPGKHLPAGSKVSLVVSKR